MTTHYIAMAGLHGYLPNYCEVADTEEEAVDTLALLHELDDEERECLMSDLSIELDLDTHGNEYAEVEECNCGEPWVHSDGQTEAEWKADHAEEMDADK